LWDDGSTDDTPAVLAAYAGEAARWCARPGRSAARNHGARLARGEFLGFLDSDDRYLPTALEAHLGAFSRQPELGLTLGGYQWVDEAGQPLGQYNPWASNGALDVRGWLFDCYGMPGSALMRREWFERWRLRRGLRIADD
jgi:glycosyltransferase involved in cell wall biosynthesis